MPYPGEHASRVKDPDLFVPKSFRRKGITDGVSIVIGKLKTDPTGSTVTQAYRFDKKKFTAEQARKWLKAHKIDTISFEAAKNEMTVTEFKRHLLNEILWRHKDGRAIGIKEVGDEDFTREAKIMHYQKQLDDLHKRLLNTEAEHTKRKNAVLRAKENGDTNIEKLLDAERVTQENKEWYENRIKYVKGRYNKAKESLECPGGKIRSGGRGQGKGYGKGQGPIGVPIGGK